jgi:hypothetical protein
LEFPLRSGIEKQFQVRGTGDTPLGTLTYSQVLREAYPGAIYLQDGQIVSDRMDANSTAAKYGQKDGR